MELSISDGTYRAEAPRGFDENCSQLSLIFFSNENMDIIQKMLILAVHKKLGMRIPFQHPNRLLIAMRHIYTLYSKELPCQYREQVRELNGRVLEWVLPDMITALEQHTAYLRDISGPPALLEPPINVSRRSTKTGSLPADRQLPDSAQCCPYDSNPDYPERRPASFS